MESIDTSLINLANQISFIIIPIIIAIGIIGNILNIVVLSRSTLYKQACSRYFLANAVANLFYSSIILPYRLLADQFHIDPTKDSIIWCKLIVYVTHVDIFLTPYFIVLASIDRWCASSSNSQMRKFSSVRIARLMIVSTVIIFALFFINSAILVDLQANDFLGCSIRANTLYKQVYVIIQSCMVSLISPCLMASFGLMTIYNTKITRVQPVQTRRNRRTGYQLARMLFLQVGTHVILITPSAITYLMYVLPNDIKTTSGFFFASIISLLLFDASYVTAFFLYVLVGRIYRNQLVRFGKRLCRRDYLTQVHPINTINKTTPMTLHVSSVQAQHS